MLRSSCRHHISPGVPKLSSTALPDVYRLHWSDGFNLMYCFLGHPYLQCCEQPSKAVWQCVCAHTHVCILIACVFNYLSIAQPEECRNFPVSDLEGTDHVGTLVSLAKLRIRRIRSSEGRQWHSRRSLLKISLVAFNLAHQSPPCPIPSLLLSGPDSLLSLFSVLFYPLTSTASPGTPRATIKDMRNQ